ncbi:bifunctional (p)ppGpp synthetase/guanosine-3',5'-bis(diphosphate) 3'-pyrophosphohydrolase, partial [Auritidibacter sp. NML120779]
DRTSLLSDVTRILAEHHVNILSATSTTRKNRIASSSFVFEMGDPGYLKHLLNAIRRIDGVYEVYRSSERKKRSSKK